MRHTETPRYCADYGAPGTLDGMVRDEEDEAQQEVQRVRAVSGAPRLAPVEQSTPFVVVVPT